MKRKILYSILLMVMLLPSLIKAQSPSTPVIYKEWTFLGENAQQIEIEYRIIKCETIAQVHLFIFNESQSDKNVQLIIEITNKEDNQLITKEVDFQTRRMGMYKALCASDISLNTLKIDIPSSYNPANINVKITLKP